MEGGIARQLLSYVLFESLVGKCVVADLRRGV